MNDKNLYKLTNKLRNICFNEGLVRIKEIIRSVNHLADKNKLDLEYRKDKLKTIFDLKDKDILVRNNDSVSLTDKGFKKANTEENKEKEFTDNLEIFGIYIINEFKKQLRKTNATSRTWNIKQYQLEEELLNPEDKLTLKQELRLMFMIQKESSKDTNWLMNAVTSYVKKALIDNSKEAKTLFKSNKLEIIASLESSKVYLIYLNGESYERPFSLDELALFKNVMELFKR